MRVEFDPKDFDIALADFGKHFAPIAEKFEHEVAPRALVTTPAHDHFGFEV